MYRKPSFETCGRWRLPASASVCLIPCLILCLAYHINQIAEGAPKAIEFPHHDDIALAREREELLSGREGRACRGVAKVPRPRRIATMTCATGFYNAIRVVSLRREPSPLPVAEPTGFTTAALTALACKIAPICLTP